MRNLFLLTLACGSLCGLSAPTHAQRYSPRVGEPHPDFTLPNLAERAPVSLSHFRGRKVLLVHFASW